MKRILCLVIAMVGLAAYAKPWQEASDLMTAFFDRGGAIYDATDSDELHIIPKASVTLVKVSDYKLWIYCNTGEEVEEYGFERDRCRLSLDAQGNLFVRER
ncbi:MAG: hypothetical protein K2O09_07700 [Treponemataceae bacterium]|nr:hypothetical protein [Treponemataceae bacterium]